MVQDVVKLQQHLSFIRPCVLINILCLLMFNNTEFDLTNCFIFRMSARRKANILGSRNMNSTKPLPTILSRKRKNDEEDPMQTVSLIIIVWKIFNECFSYRISIVILIQSTQT